MMDRVVIVGASAGGLATAEALRRMAYEGSITLVGDEPCMPYDRPPLSKQILAGEWEPDRLALRRRPQIDALNLDLRLGLAAISLDTNERIVTLSDGSRVPYDGLVVATGVRPRRLPGSDGIARVRTLRTVDDALTLRSGLRPGRRLVIVGAGFIGAEVAAVARKLGVEVTMLEAARVPMAAAVGEQVGMFLAQAHIDRDVDVRTGVSVAGIRGAKGVVQGVELSDGTMIPADDVLVAIGSVPNTDWLTGSGLTIHNGIVCDEYCAAASGVYGVGDVARWRNPLFDTEMRIEHRTNATEQGMAVARNLLNPGKRQPFAPVPYFWSDQYEMKVQAYGNLRDHDEASIADGGLAQGRFVMAYRKGDQLAGVLAVGMPPKVLRTWRALIAAGGTWSDAMAGAAATF